MPKVTSGTPPLRPSSTSPHAPTPAPTSAKANPPSVGAWGSGRTTSLEERRAAATSVTTSVATLSDTERAAVVEKKATCPFIGAAVKGGDLKVRNDANKPLAGIDDVAALGNTGPGSNLGEVLRLFAQGNHAFMEGSSGRLDTPAPLGTFSLDFPGSQGSHAGHSGILQGDPTTLNSGRLSEKDLARLTRFAKNGVVTRSDIGRFIAENVHADPNAKAPGVKTGLVLAKDFAKLVGEVGQSVADRAHGQTNPEQDRRVLEKLTRVLGDDNLIGSAGEFGLLATFLMNSPKTKQVGGEPAFAVDDLKAMFVEKRLPEGWETWKKTAGDWVANTSALAFAAEKARRRLAHGEGE